MQWAFNQDIKPSSVKFVLVSLGDNAQHDGLAWPSIAALSQKTGQDRKTVIAALDKLEAMGYLADSGKRTGKTGQVKVYKFNFDRTNNTENGTVPKAEQFRNSRQTVPDSPGNSTVFPSNSTENGTRNPQEPSKEPEGNQHKRGRAARDDFDPLQYLIDRGVERKVAKDWIKLRKGKGLAPIETAFEGVIEQAALANMTLHDALKTCCERGWGGFKARWLQGDGPGAAPNKQEALEQRNRDIAARLAAGKSQ